MTKTSLLLTLLLLITSLAARAELLTLPQGAQQISAGAHATWITGTQSMTPAAAMQRLLKRQGHPTGSDFPSFGLTRSSRWLLLRLDNQSEQVRWMLEAGRPHIDRLDVYLFDAYLQPSGHWWSGSTRPMDERPYRNAHLVFPLALSPGKSYLLLHAASHNVLDLPITLFTPDAFYQLDSQRELVNGLFFGTILVLCLYNLLLFFSTRERSYLTYILYIGTFGLFLAAREGLALRWLWPGLPDWNSISMTSIVYLTIGFSMLFLRDFLQLSRLMPRVSRLFVISAAIFALCAVISPFYPFEMTLLNNVPTLLWPFVAVIVSIAVLRKGYEPAKYFLLASALLAVAVVLYSLKSLHYLPNSWLLENSLQIGIVLEALLLSFALAHRMTLIKQHNEHLQQEAQQQLEQKVRERTRELHAALSARSQFLAVMSHEIRTPLNGILGTLDLLKNSTLNNSQQQQVNVIESSGNSLLQLIDDILDYTRIEAGKMPLNEDTFSIANLVQECCALFEQKAALNGDQLTLSLDANVGDHARGDALRVRQLLVNLISNAIKFTENGSINIRIRRETSNSDYVYFAVEDSGIGIAEDKLSLLFDLFQQADNSTSRQYGGTGLGLAVCQQLVEVMGGEIGVTSKPGQGSTFWFHLPLPAADASAPTQQPHVEPPERAARLLIVDDNNINLMVAEGLCKKLGHEVETCDSGSEAIATLLNDERPFDAILMDCEMPIMDGFATTREIIRLQKEGRIRNIPIVALTAHAVPDKIRACHEAGMVMHIAKPVNLDKLHAHLERVLNTTD